MNIISALNSERVFQRESATKMRSMASSSKLSRKQTPSQTGNLVGMQILKSSLRDDLTETTRTSVSSTNNSRSRSSHAHASGSSKSKSQLSKASPKHLSNVVKQLVSRHLDLSRAIVEKQDKVQDAETTLMLEEQEKISKSFGSTIKRMIRQIVERDVKIEDQASKLEFLESQVQRSIEALDIKASEISNLHSQVNRQQNEITRLHSELSTRDKMSGLSQKSSEQGIAFDPECEPDNAMASPQKESTFLLSAYKEECRCLEARIQRMNEVSKSKGSRPNLRLRNSCMPSGLIDQTLPQIPEVAFDADSVDMSLYTSRDRHGP